MTTHVDKEWQSRAKFSIPAFFAGRSIFITGSTGFLGKALIEKLLRSCPDIREIFLLLRPKKGMSSEERLKKTLELSVFDRIRAENPSNFHKLIVISGDTTVEGLGLSETDRQTLIDRVSVIFHVAANVRFDEDLKKDILSNTRSTRDICILGKSMKNLVSLVHVSTAYCQTDKRLVEEIVYPQLTDWRSAIRMAENLDEYTIRTITAKYIGTMPNTYTFSKRLAEGVVNDYSKELPVVIIRPSIVISSMEEPISGWIDNFNGPVGLLVAGGKGVLRVTKGDPDVFNDYLPADIAIKAMAIVAWTRGIKSLAMDPDIHVYNCTSFNLHRTTFKELVEMGFRTLESTPLGGMIWYPRTIIVANSVLHYLLTVFMHLLPSFILDGILQLAGHKPMLRRLYTKIFFATQRLNFFIQNEWDFNNKKLIQLLSTLSPSDEKIFHFNYQYFDKTNYYKNAILGAKRFLLKETESLESTKRKYERMKWIDRIYNAFVLTLLIWIFWRAGFFAYITARLRHIADGSFLN